MLCFTYKQMTLQVFESGHVYLKASHQWFITSKCWWKSECYSNTMRTNQKKATLQEAYNQLWCDWMMRAEWAAPSYPKPFIWALAKLRGKEKCSLCLSVSLRLPLLQAKTQMRTHKLKQTHKRHTEPHRGIRQLCLFTVWRATVSTHACRKTHKHRAENRVCLHTLALQWGRMCVCVCVCVCFFMC